MASVQQFRHEDVSAVPRGYKVRTVRHPSGHQVRVAYPPGPRRKGAGKLVSILHPKRENPRTCSNQGIVALLLATPIEELLAAKALQSGNPLSYYDYSHARRSLATGATHEPATSRYEEIVMRGDRSHPQWGREYDEEQKRLREFRRTKGGNPKSRTREQVEKMQAKAVKFLRNVVKDSKKADEIEGMSVAEYAEKKGISLTNPGKEKGKGKKAKGKLSSIQHRALKMMDSRGAGAIALAPLAGDTRAQWVWPEDVRRDRRVAAAVIRQLTKGSAAVFNPKSRRNQAGTEAAAALYEIFHGKKPKEIIELHQDVMRREDYAALGQLVEITLPDLNIALDFESDKVLLAASPNGKQMYVIGGNQDLRSVLGKLADDEKDFLDLGEVGAVVYRTRKDFDKFEEIDYKHKMGEGGHEKPRAMYDKLNKQIYFVGGEYDASRHEGIVH